MFLGAYASHMGTPSHTIVFPVQNHVSYSCAALIFSLSVCLSVYLLAWLATKPGLQVYSELCFAYV